MDRDQPTRKGREPRSALPLRSRWAETRFRLTNSFRKGPTSMREPLSRPGRDDCGTSQTSIRHQPPRRRAMREYAVAPIHAGGVALRHVGPPGCDLSPALDLDVKPSSYRRTARRGPPPATEKMASGGPGGGHEPPGRRHGRGEIWARRPPRRRPAARPAHADSLIRSPLSFSRSPSPRSTAGPPHDAEAGALASAGFSCQSVPRFSRAHITRTR